MTVMVPADTMMRLKRENLRRENIRVILKKNLAIAFELNMQLWQLEWYIPSKMFDTAWDV